MSISEFIDGISIPVDLHVKISDDKFVVIAKAGQKTLVEQLSSYQSKKLEYLWVRKKDYSKLTRQSVTLAGIVVNKDNIKLENKSSIISIAASSVFNQLEHMGISIEMYNNAKQVTEATMSLAENHKDLSGLMQSLVKSSDELLNHCMAVSALSVMIGVHMGWEKKVTLEKLALGGLLHDIGLKSLPPELLKKPISQMTFEETQLFETHPYRGMQMLQSLGIVPEDIVSIVYEHQENSLGQGYPQRIRDVKIHPLAKVVALADQFVYLTVKNINTPVPKSPREAIMFIEHTLGTPYNKEAFKALKNLVDGSKLTMAS